MLGWILRRPSCSPVKGGRFTRLAYDLGAQTALGARAKAVEAVKAVKANKRDTRPRVGPRGSIRYNARTYRLLSLDPVSLNTLEGRVICRLELGVRQHEMPVSLAWEIGGAELVWTCGVCYLHVTQSREAPDAFDNGGACWLLIWAS